MNAGDKVDPLYVQARRVLLDALHALAPHRGAFVVAGAQAIYLRTGDADLAVAPYTTDGDLALDPERLGDDPRLGASMATAGFTLALEHGHPEPGAWVRSVTVHGAEFEVPVDLIVPEGASDGRGRRGARLGVHGKMAAHRAIGLEAALVDRDEMLISPLASGGGSAIEAPVAGSAALLVAKAHKLHERAAAGLARRLVDKDALDVLRLMQTTAPSEVAPTLRALCDHPLAGRPSVDAVRYLEELFGRRGRRGVEMAARAVRVGMSSETVAVICTRYTAELVESVAAM